MRLIVGISGASGTVYGVRLLEVLKDSPIETHLVMTELNPAGHRAGDRLHRRGHRGPRRRGARQPGRRGGHRLRLVQDERDGRRAVLDEEPVGHRAQLQRHPDHPGRRRRPQRRPQARPGGPGDSPAPGSPAPDDSGRRDGSRHAAADAQLLPPARDPRRHRQPDRRQGPRPVRHRPPPVPPLGGHARSVAGRWTRSARSGSPHRSSAVDLGHARWSRRPTYVRVCGFFRRSVRDRSDRHTPRAACCPSRF